MQVVRQDAERQRVERVPCAGLAVGRLEEVDPFGQQARAPIGKVHREEERAPGDVVSTVVRHGDGVSARDRGGDR